MQHLSPCLQHHRTDRWKNIRVTHMDRIVLLVRQSETSARGTFFLHSPPFVTLETSLLHLEQCASRLEIQLLTLAQHFSSTTYVCRVNGGCGGVGWRGLLAPSCLLRSFSLDHTNLLRFVSLNPFEGPLGFCLHCTRVQTLHINVTCACALLSVLCRRPSDLPLKL